MKEEVIFFPVLSMKGAGLKTDLISTEFIPSRLQSGIVTDGLILYLNV